MHILIIPSWYKSEKLPFVGTFFEEQARMLKKKGLKIGILCPEHQPSFFSFIKNPVFTRKSFDDDGIYTFYSITKSIVPGVKGFYINKKVIERYAYKSFLQYCRINGTPDIIHSHSIFWGAVVANYILKRTGIPFVHTEHLSAIVHTNEYDVQPFKSFVIESYENSAQNIFVSNSFKDSVVRKFKLKNAITVHNLVNPVFYDTRKNKKSDLSDYKIINIGGLIPRKNQLTLIEAIKVLQINIKCNITLTIIGQGPLYKQLIKEADSLNGNIKVKFIKEANREKIAELMRINHVLISTSIFETFGLTVAEALASGTPVVSYKTMGTDDMMGPDNGIVVTENTPNAYANALAKIYENYQTFDPIKISNDCYNEFSEEIISNKIIDIYNKILDKSD